MNCGVMCAEQNVCLSENQFLGEARKQIVKSSTIYYNNLDSKNRPNLRINCYTHFIIHFKHSIDVKFDLLSFKVCKREQNTQNVSPKGVKIIKSTIISQICQFGV